MKSVPLYSIPQIQAWDRYTIENEPIESIELMERASLAVVDWFVSVFEKKKSIGVLCGPGNNGGDGFAVSRILLERGCNVIVYAIGDQRSADGQVNYERLQTKPISLKSTDQIDIKHDLVVDAIFGSGLTRPVDGLYGEIIDHLNSMEALRVSIDIPSGMFGDEINIAGAIFKADQVGTFQIPKRSMLYPESSKYCRAFEVLDIGLSSEYKVDCDQFYLTESSLLEPDRFSHKGTNGKALIIAGSHGKMGACILAATAALRSGVGLLVTHIPESGNEIIQVAVPEAMTTCDKESDIISEVPNELSSFDSVDVGPGIGTSSQTAEVVRELLKKKNVKTLLDADALNCIAKYDLKSLLHANCVLTPHPKEFERLFGSSTNSLEAIKKQISASKEYGCVIVRKGAHTSITSPDGKIYFNSTGNPGMATAGSGDVLSGVITALLANGLSPIESALEGVFNHGVAGDKALAEHGYRNMKAGDIVEKLFT
jgi:NAD(P)H-hydrate epimerase